MVRFGHAKRDLTSMRVCGLHSIVVRFGHIAFAVQTEIVMRLHSIVVRFGHDEPDRYYRGKLVYIP